MRLEFRILALAAIAFASSVAHGKNAPSKELRITKLLETMDPGLIRWAFEGMFGSRDYRPGLPRFDLPCNVCLGVADALIGDLEQGVSLEEIIDAIVPFCSFLVYDEDVCRGLLEVNTPTLAWVIQNSATFDVNRFCAEGIGAVGCDDYVVSPDAWVVPLPDVPKPPVGRPEVPADAPLVKVLHVADIHLDQLYEVGAAAECGKIICCQSIDGTSNNPAGIFGMYEPCDAPQTLVDETFRAVLEQHPDIDMVFFTGDMPAHDIWRQSIDGNNAAIDAVMTSLKQYFGDIPVYNTFGNHEPHPLNVYSFAGLDAPAEFLTDYIYENAWSHWSQWLPADQEANVKKAGQWSISPREGLRLIGFNNLYGYIMNWFVWMDVPDPNGQLEWLANELQLAEDNGEHVLLLSHIPPGNHNLEPVWSHNFAKIVNRYENIIRGQFYGHTHNDEFSIFYNEDGQPSNVAFIAPSVTTYEELNPAYRILYFDGARGAESTWTLMDIENWQFDLEAANAAGTPTWYKFYSMKEAFGMSDLSPASYDALAQQLRNDDAVFEMYHRGYWSDSPRRPDCDSECRAEHVCDVLTSDTSDKSRC